MQHLPYTIQSSQTIAPSALSVLLSDMYLHKNLLFFFSLFYVTMLQHKVL